MQSSRRVEVFDGQDLACGELLLRLVAHLVGLRHGTVVRVVATDPAAPIDIPFWCHLTGHRYLGSGQQADGRAHFDIVVNTEAASTTPGRPWRVRPHSDVHPHPQAPTPTSRKDPPCPLSSST